MLNIAICDDDKYMVSLIQDELNDIAAQMLIKINITKYSTSAEPLKMINDGAFSFDMIFLDMYIDENLGLDIAREIRKKNHRCAIIFITAFADRMVDCFEWKASAYIIKPVEKDKLARAFKTALKHLDCASMFYVNAKGSEMAVPFDEIMYFENNLKTVNLYRANVKEPVVFSGTIKNISAPSEYFYICHQSFLVNFAHIEMIDKAKHDIVMKNGARIHISRRYYAGILFGFTRFHSIVRS